MASRKKTELKNEITFKDNKMTMGLPNISMKGPLFFFYNISSTSKHADCFVTQIRSSIHSTVSVNAMLWNCAVFNLLAYVFHFSVPLGLYGLSQASSDNLQMSDSKNKPRCVSKPLFDGKQENIISERYVTII